MDLHKKREEVMTCCGNITEKNVEIQNGDSHILIKKMAEQLSTRAREIKVICDTEKYDLFFNGKVAIGKSTVICTLFNLIDYSVLSKGSRLSNSLLLKTGSGRTTVCETQIIPHADRTEMLIEPVSNEDFCVFLQEFCECLQGKESVISEESLALIKNMAEIPLSSSNDEILNQITNETSIFEKLKEIINYESRQKISFAYEGKDFNSWFKAVFTEINDGKCKLAPMPKRIIIKINDSDSTFKIPSYINSIIDTRGLDGGERPDIQLHIQSNSAISFMCDEINGYGGNESIISILQQTLIKEDKDRPFRVILLGMEKNGELDNITNFEDNRKAGIKEKKRQAMKKLNDAKINLTDSNLLFFDTAPGIGIEKNKISEIDINILHDTQKEFSNSIQKVIHDMYSNYCDELYDSLKLLEQLNRGKITSSLLEKINESQKIVDTILNQVKTESNDIVNKFQSAVRQIYHASLRGAVNHCGIGNTADVYGSFQKCGGDEFIEKCGEYKIKMLTSIEMIFRNCDDLEKICLRYIFDKIDELYKNHYTTYRSLAYSETYNNLCNNNSWAAPQRYWGDGVGNYNLRVWNDLDQEIKHRKIDVKIVNCNSKVQFFQDVFDFLIV